MRILRVLLPGILLYLLAASSCQAQAVNLYCYSGTPGPKLWAPCDTANPLAITGTITASLGGFTPASSGARGTPLTVTTSDSSGSLPGSPGSVVVVSNVGSNPMYCNVNGIIATTADQYISSSGGWFAFTIPSGQSALHCIATGGSTTANMLAGAGLATGTGGGGGSGGGAGAVTLASGAVASGAYSAGAFASGAAVAGAFADGAIATLGTEADNPCSLPTTSTGCSLIALEKALNNQLISPSGTPTQTSVTVTTSSGTLIAASTFSNFMKVCVALTAANGIWVRWDGGVATQAAPAELIPPGQCDTWDKITGYLPTGNITAIAAASVAVSVIGN